MIWYTGEDSFVCKEKWSPYKIAFAQKVQAPPGNFPGDYQHTQFVTMF